VSFFGVTWVAHQLDVFAGPSCWQISVSAQQLRNQQRRHRSLHKSYWQ
jgi:hypothetical protein